MNKNDPEYIERLQYLIQQKYGADAVRNLREDWTEEKEKQYQEQIKILEKKEDQKNRENEKVEKNGFLVDKKLITKDSSRICKICNTYSFEKKDDVYFNKFGCCYICFLKYFSHIPPKGWEAMKNYLYNKDKDNEDK